MTQTALDNILEEMLRIKASDLYIAHQNLPSLRVGDALHSFGDTVLDDAAIAGLLVQLLTPEQLDEYQSTLELNAAVSWRGQARFRINVFRQQGHEGIVIRRIENQIPNIEELGLPSVYGEMALQKRGLVLVAGPTGSGKSTSLAAMIGHRNTHGSGHIITVEDPIEYVHTQKQCIISQRDVGLDTYSYSIALKNALRQRPDMVVIGEIRDREVMEQAIYFAETSHLCIATIHANNSSQAIERIINFFPEERHAQVLANLSLNLRAVLSQRLVNTIDQRKALALEIMINRGLIKQYIEEGKVRQLREMIEKGASDGMITFDQSLASLYMKNIISEETAFAESDSPANLRVSLNTTKPNGSSAKIQAAIRIADKNEF